VNKKQLLLLIALLGIVVTYFMTGAEEMLDPRKYQALYKESPLTTVLIFFAIYLTGTALSLPVTGVLSVVSGMIFGHLIGAPLALLACTIGGTIAYLVSRYLLHTLVQQRFAAQLASINKGIEAEGAFYLFCLRMIPVIPFWLLNLLVGLTSIGVARFFVATLLGMLPVTLILVHFGTQLSTIDRFSVTEIFTPGLLLSLALLAVMPFVARQAVRLIRRRLSRN